MEITSILILYMKFNKNNKLKTGSDADWMFEQEVVYFNLC